MQRFIFRCGHPRSFIEAGIECDAVEKEQIKMYQKTTEGFSEGLECPPTQDTTHDKYVMGSCPDCIDTMDHYRNWEKYQYEEDKNGKEWWNYYEPKDAWEDEGEWPETSLFEAAQLYQGEWQDNYRAQEAQAADAFWREISLTEVAHEYEDEWEKDLAELFQKYQGGSHENKGAEDAQRYDEGGLHTQEASSKPEDAHREQKAQSSDKEAPDNEQQLLIGENKPGPAWKFFRINRLLHMRVYARTMWRGM